MELGLIIRPHPTYIVSVSARSRVTHCCRYNQRGVPSRGTANQSAFFSWISNFKRRNFCFFLLKHMHPCACAVPYHGEQACKCCLCCLIQSTFQSASAIQFTDVPVKHLRAKQMCRERQPSCSFFINLTTYPQCALFFYTQQPYLNRVCSPDLFQATLHLGFNLISLHMPDIRYGCTIIGCTIGCDLGVCWEGSATLVSFLEPSCFSANFLPREGGLYRGRKPFQAGRVNDLKLATP